MMAPKWFPSKQLLQCSIVWMLLPGILAATTRTNDTVPVKALGMLSVSNPGSIAVVFPQHPSLFVSSVANAGQGSVYRVNGIANFTSTTFPKSRKAAVVPGKINSPSRVTEAPVDVFGSEGVVVGGGSLTSGNQSDDGGVYYSKSLNGASQAWTTLASKADWRYHHITFKDLDGDGVAEMICCRTSKVVSGQSALVILKLRDRSKPTDSWDETEIAPDCSNLAVGDLNGDARVEIVSVSASRVKLYYTADAMDWNNVTKIQSITIDATLKDAVDVQFTDVNNDGHVDVIVADQSGSGRLYAYEITQQQITDPSKYVRRTLASGFYSSSRTPKRSASGLQERSARAPAPLAATPFYYSTSTRAGGGGSGSGDEDRPYIALSGGSATSRRAYVLLPYSQPGRRDEQQQQQPSPEGWEYRLSVLYDCQCAVGTVAVADVNGDGNPEIFVPCSDRGFVAALSFGGTE